MCLLKKCSPPCFRCVSLLSRPGVLPVAKYDCLYLNMTPRLAPGVLFDPYLSCAQYDRSIIVPPSTSESKLQQKYFSEIIEDES